MNWYRVTKTIHGRQYYYWQKTRREGKHVRTENRYIGPADGTPSEPPERIARLAELVRGSDTTNRRIVRKPERDRHGEMTGKDEFVLCGDFPDSFGMATTAAMWFPSKADAEAVLKAAGPAKEPENPELSNPFHTSPEKIDLLRDVLTNDEYSDEEELGDWLAAEHGLAPEEAAWWAGQRPWYWTHMLMDDGGIFDPKTGTVANPRTGKVTEAPFAAKGRASAEKKLPEGS
jgi:hypothetical protein